MLQNIREGIQGPWAIGIVALIVVSFVFTGVGGYISSNNSAAVAVVNGEEIPAGELDLAYQNERGRLESQFGEAINSLFASESYVTQFRSDILDRLISDELLSQKAKELGLRVSDEQVKQAILELPEFQVAGVFNNDRYNNAIARAGYTPSDFAEYMRDQMTRQQLVRAVNGSNFSVSYQVQQALALQQQTRSAQSVEIDIAKYKDSVELSEEEINDYYNANLANFDTQEQVKLAYVTLAVSDLESKVDVNAEEIEEYYNTNIAAYSSDEIRRISHIMVELGDDEDASLAKAQALLVQLNAGEDFATVAQSSSEDIATAEEGGDLGEISRDDFTGAFGDAAFALSSVGQISDVVKSEEGFHIIKLTEFTPQVVTGFAQVRDSIEAEIRTSKATDEFFALQQEMARLAFEEPDSLEAVADVTGRPIIETAFFQRNQLPAGVNYPAVEDAAFSLELIEDQVNSDLLELGNNLVMVTRVAEHKPQRTRALDEVITQIETALKEEKAQEQALIYAQTIQTALFDQADTSTLLAEQSLEWVTNESLSRRASELPLDMVEELFTLSPVQGQDTGVVTMSNGNVGVVKLLSVQDAVVDPSVDTSDIEQRLASSKAQQSYENFIAALRANAEVEIITQ
jgi:peptidyl-prolyl cis-trans isomerase D